MRKCETCDGTCEVSLVAYYDPVVGSLITLDYEMDSYPEVTCPRCNGTGTAKEAKGEEHAKHD